MQAAPALGQNGIFVSQTVKEHLGNELSGGIASQTVQKLLDLQQLTNPENYYRSVEYLETRARELGLHHIKLTELPDTRTEWDVRKAELWMLSPVTRKLANFQEAPNALAVYSRSTHAMAELVDVGAGEREADYAGKEVANKFVLAHGDLDLVMQQAVWQRGALGILSFFDHPTPSENPAWQAIPLSNGNGKPGTFAFTLPSEIAYELKRIIKSKSERTTFGREKNASSQTSILLRADIDASVRDTGKSWQLMTEIPGEEILSEDIVLTAFLPDNAAPPFGDLSGAAGLLEIARTVMRLINDGLLPLPRRTIRFWWLPASHAVATHFTTRPEAKDSILATLHLGAIGYANAFSGGTRLLLAPPSNSNYWNDVLESIAIATEQGAAKQTARDTHRLLDPTFLYSQAGTAEPFLLEISGQDRHPVTHFFSQSAISIPSIAMTSRQDRTFRRRDQLTASLNPVQIKRNLFLTAAAAWYLSGFTDSDIPSLVAKVYQNGQAHMAKALGIAFDLIVSEEREGYLLADLLIEESILRETETLQSISVLAAHSDALEVINDFLNTYRDDEKTAQNRLKLLFSNLYQNRPPKRQLDANEKTALRIIPRNVPDLRTYLSQQSAAAHDVSYWEQEILNFVNGQRSIYEIYRAVLAESLLFPHKLDQPITLDFVQSVISKAVDNRILTF